MPQIDRWVINATLTAISGGEIKLASHRSCAVNISGQTPGDESFLGFVVDALDRTGVSPSSICFEVTEKAILSNVQHAQRFIEVLHGIGCEFSLDDFGSGLGSFSSLKHLPIDYLKIDGSFVRDMVDNTVDCAMVSAIHHLGRVMGVKTIAEFVENETILEKLAGIGVDYAQGYGIGRPRELDADEPVCRSKPDKTALLEQLPQI